MTLTDLIRRHPRPYEPERAADTLAKLPDPGAARNLLEGVAGCSPYLAGLMTREAAWLEQALAADPATTLAQVLDALEPGPAKETGAALRVAKRRVALLAGLADCGGVWDLAQVTGALTRLSDRAVEVALQTVLAPLLRAGKIPGQTEADLATCAGLTVLSMGKTGARELNYSSDIDLIVLFDDDRFSSADLPEARMQFIRAVRKAMALLSDLTGEGYVFRTDLRLRPDPSVTPVAMAISAAIRYYESLGRTWERAAFIKARPSSGDLRAGRDFLQEIRPFIWRRHLDFATIEETQEMQAKIRSQKNTWDGTRLDGRNLKLGPGGIREIEFFTQTRQMIAGGRDPSLRVRGTCSGLERLAEAGWIPQEDAAALAARYRSLRSWEHRVQMIQDAQTHALPRDAAGWDRLAAFLDRPDAAALRAEMAQCFETVQGLTAPLMLPRRAEETAPADPRAAEVAERWHGFAALRSDRARAILARLLPDLLRRFERAAKPEEALLQFERFLSRLPAGVQVFSLFEANPHLIDLMVDIASSSPVLAEYLSRNAQVLDAVIGGSFFAPWPGRAGLAADLSETLDQDGGDYEQILDGTRRWHREWRFRIGVHLLRGLIDASEAAAQYSDLAEAVLEVLAPAVVAQFAEKHGHLPGGGAVLVGMGSLGARSLAASSDLDLIVIYDAPAEAVSDGARALDVRSYYARLTKAFVTALSAQMSEGTLYEVDMRLRPSGRQGPVATSWSGFRRYQREEAWTWEHMALTRARVIAGPQPLAEAFETFRREIVAGHADRGRVFRDLAEMRERLRTGKPQKGPWDTENGPGGRQDIELLAQACALVAGSAERDPLLQLGTGDLAPEAAGRLGEQLRLWAVLKQAGRLLSGGRPDPSHLGQGGRDMLLRDTAMPDIGTLEARIAEGRAAAAQLVDQAVRAGAD
ncbi:[protein-PII] uridylyltransferase family protein [Mangrovicoccus algicola]|uniref:Glutamine-synthetase adenylyltransferase n=1 Tax=Mangrovicoccus algicola TaxID=2771008 RepID=A0A8J6YYW3_9RHOB|nr:glutamine-synthetase adenylyltransferase [Mangrovicoccus algicola]MBE3640342.1 glutamine-synthetase adenylyltransferase [Mangrovicoccus algicola]